MKETEETNLPAVIAIDFEELSSSPEQYIQNLITSLGSPDERVRKYAFEVMCELADERAVRILTGYLNHRDNLVRYSVRKALDSICEKCPGRFDAIAGGARAEGAAQRLRFFKPALALFATVFAVTLAGLVLLDKPREDKHMAAVAGRVDGEARSRAAARVAGKNVIVFDAKGAPSIKLSGIVSSYNPIKREAVVDLNAYGDSCRLVFADDARVDIIKGARIEVEAEIVRNDNINPVLLKAKPQERPGGVKK